MFHWDCILSNKYYMNCYCDVAEIRISLYILSHSLIDGSLLKKILLVRILDSETLIVRYKPDRSVCFQQVKQTSWCIHEISAAIKQSDARGDRSLTQPDEQPL